MNKNLNISGNREDIENKEKLLVFLFSLKGLSNYFYFIGTFISISQTIFPITSAEYVEDIYQAFLVAQDKDQLRPAMQELSEMNPPPMNTMLEKQSREEAIQKRTERKGKTVQDVPSTAPGN